MNIEELQALNPEVKIKEAIELHPEARYIIVLEDKVNYDQISRIAEVFRQRQIDAIICDIPMKVYKLDA